MARAVAHYHTGAEPRGKCAFFREKCVIVLDCIH
jgi:hypothetical protein